MFKRLSNGWLIGVAITLVMTSSAWCQDKAISANVAAAPPLQIKQEAPANTVDGGRIQVTFGESEKDLLTRAAVEKLEAPIESLEFSNADLRNVIRIIGERLNINFIFDAGDISGNITLRLRNVRLRDALDSILKTRKLAIVVDPSGIFRIVPQEQINRKTIETRTEVIQLNWIRADDVAKTMKPFLSSDSEGRLIANEESNTILVTDVPPQIEVIRKLIEKIDVPERQVGIEARLVDINMGAMRELSTRLSASKINNDLGITNRTENHSYTNENGDIKISDSITDTFGGVDTLGVVNNMLEGISVKGGMGTLALGDTINVFGSDYNLNAVFTALETRDVVEILANPKVATLNNVPANIEIVEKIPYVSAAQISNGTQTNEIMFKDAGVKIQVRPIITPNDFVRMEIELSQKIFRGRVGSDSLDPPKIDERNAKTNVIVQTGSTAVLGGLRQQNLNEGIEGVPWLHRIPLIGWLFKNKNYSQSKTELVLMMTPSIIKGTQQLTDREKKFYEKIDTRWDLPDYMMDDVSGPNDLHKPDKNKKNHDKSDKGEKK